MKIDTLDLDTPDAWTGVSLTFAIGPIDEIPGYLSSISGAHIVQEERSESAPGYESFEVFKEGANDSWTPSPGVLCTIAQKYRSLKRWVHLDVMHCIKSVAVAHLHTETDFEIVLTKTAIRCQDPIWVKI